VSLVFRRSTISDQLSSTSLDTYDLPSARPVVERDPAPQVRLGWLSSEGSSKEAVRSSTVNRSISFYPIIIVMILLIITCEFPGN